MTRTLARHVHVRNPDDGEMHVFAAGEQPPEWARELITNPRAWGEDGSPSAEEVYAAQTGAVPPAAGDETPAETEGGVEAPPKSGRRQNSPPKA